MSSYTIQELAYMKGTSEPVRAALYVMDAEITNLRAELAEARDKAAEIVRDQVYAEAHDTEWDTGFNYAKSMAIRAIKSTKPQSALSGLIASTADEYDLPPIL